jgi:hypothetical protein
MNKNKLGIKLISETEVVITEHRNLEQSQLVLLINVIKPVGLLSGYRTYLKI